MPESVKIGKRGVVLAGLAAAWPICLGFILWVEMPEGTDAILLYHRALEKGISIVPGPLFSLSNKYGHHIRLSAAHWDNRIEQGIKTLGALAHELLPG